MFYLRVDIYEYDSNGSVIEREADIQKFEIGEYEEAISYCLREGAENEAALRVSGRTGEDRLYTICVWHEADSGEQYADGSEANVERALECA